MLSPEVSATSVDCVEVDTVGLVLLIIPMIIVLTHTMQNLLGCCGGPPVLRSVLSSPVTAVSEASELRLTLRVGSLRSSSRELYVASLAASSRSRTVLALRLWPAANACCWFWSNEA